VWTWLDAHATAMQAVSAVVSVLVALVSAVVAVVVARLTGKLSREATRARQDALLPRVVPIGLAEVVPFAQAVPMTDVEGNALRVRNVGAGPALNLTVELRYDQGAEVLRRHEGGVRDLAAGDQAPVVQWTENKPVRIEEGVVASVEYDDAFGRHFRTRSRRKGAGWFDSETEEIKDRPARWSPSVF
jgi:hypothetical protein